MGIRGLPASGHLITLLPIMALLMTVDLVGLSFPSRLRDSRGFTPLSSSLFPDLRHILYRLSISTISSPPPVIFSKTGISLAEIP